MGSAEVQGQMWGLAAKDWAELQEPHHEPLWQVMLDEGSVGSGTRVLDAGGGGGGASLLAAKRGAVVSGLDAAVPLIELAMHRVPEGDFRVGDIYDLPFDDRSFDAFRGALPQPLAGKGPFELSEPGVLEDLFLRVEMSVTGSGEVECLHDYADRETFCRAAASGGQAQRCFNG